MKLANCLRLTPLKSLPQIVYLIILLSLVSSCNSPKEQLVQQQLFTFGTLVDISIWTDKPKQAHKIIGQISADFEKQHRQWHPSHSGSSLVKLNKQLAQAKVAKLDPSLYSLTKLAIYFSKQSDELFNPAIGQLVDLWHFDQLQQENNHDSPTKIVRPPSLKQITALLNLRPSMTQLQLDESSQQLKSTNSSIKLDFGAFAKGYAVEFAIKTLKKAGFKNALVNAGGDIKAIGSKADVAWKIGIRNPFYQQQTDKPVIASISLNDNESIMTSGDYERFFIFKNKSYHHIIDPRTGYPASGFHSVTIVHTNATLADAAATAIFIAGPQRWEEIAKKMAIDKIMLISQAGELIVSQQLKSRLALIPNKRLKTTIITLD